MNYYKKLGALLLAVVIAFSMTACSGADKKIIKIGHKNYTEQRILGQMFGVLLEAKTEYQADVKEFGGTQLVFEALKNNEINMYADYTGTLYAAVLKMSDKMTFDQVNTIVREKIEGEYNLHLGQPLGFNNTYTLSVKPEIAKEYNLKTISDLAEHGKKLTIGSTMEFLERVDGIKGVKEVYGIEFKKEVGLDPGIRYTAIENGQVDLIDAFSTDGKIKEYQLVILEDDKQFFPPYYVMSLMNDVAYKAYPEFVEALKELEGQISEEEMQQMNYLVDEEGQPEKKVAEDFLRSKGIID